MQNITDNDTFSQPCFHLDTRRKSLFLEKKDEAIAPSPFGAVFLYSTIESSPCWTESDSQQSNLDSLYCDSSSQQTSATWEADMTASWSSAATGKPQLSYAERLRKAKEGTSKADLSAPAPPSYAQTDLFSPNGRDHPEVVQNPREQKAQSIPQESIAPSTSSVQSEQDNNIKAESADDSSKVTVKSSASGQAVVNVWDARKRLLQQREKAKEDDRSVLEAKVEAHQLTSNEEGQDQCRGKDTRPVKITFEEESKSGRKTNRNEAWSQKGQLLNGGTTNERGDLGFSETMDDSLVRDKEHVNSNAKAKKNLTSAGKGEEAKGKRKKVSENVPKAKNGNTIPLPSIGDATAWPSPDVSLSIGSKSFGETGRRQDDTKGDDRGAIQSSSFPPVNDLQNLGVEVVKRVGGASPKRGKQWVPIVPTITHTASLPSNPSGKKKSNKVPVVASSSSSSPAEAKVAPTSPINFTRRLDQKRPTPLPISNHGEDIISESTSAGNLTTLLQSPSHELLGLSPRLARIALSNQTMQSSRSSSLAASPHRDYSSSPIRSPSLGGGSVRGPRFSGDLKSPKDAHTWLQPLPSDDTLPDLTLQPDSKCNALHLSDGYSDAALKVPAEMSQVVTTTDGSYPPIRANANAFSPTNQSLQQEGSPWRNNSMHRSQSNAPSPRGSRGRGKMSKASDGHSVGESSGSRNDAEDRGLPSNVPSGPRRQQNGDGTPPREGGKGYNSGGGGSFRRGPYYQQQALPYGMYGPPPPPGGFFYPPPPQFQLESTPTEFAPQGDATKSEPSEALLHQIEFYFSHRNLEGDFYLRKNMDSQGFVPIQVVANFKKVKKMTEKLNVIKETLLFSKVLFIDVERELVRKAVDWHLYILVDGERPQQNMYPPRQPLPNFGSPSLPLPPFAHASPPYASYYGQPAPPPLYFTSPYNQNAANPIAQGSVQDTHSHQSLHRSASNENIFGVIAAEGLAAERRP